MYVPQTLPLDFLQIVWRTSCYPRRMVFRDRRNLSC